MIVLLLGSGGREHALAWKLAQSERLTKLYAAPGNPGIAEVAECVDLDPLQPESVLAFARDQQVGLVVIGPEAPLVAGVADLLRDNAIPVFGTLLSVLLIGETLHLFHILALLLVLGGIAIAEWGRPKDGKA